MKDPEEVGDHKFLLLKLGVIFSITTSVGREGRLLLFSKPRSGKLFFCEGPDSKYFRLSLLHAVCFYNP